MRTMHGGTDIPDDSQGNRSADSIVEEFVGLHQADPALDLDQFMERFPLVGREEIRQRCLQYIANLAAFGPGPSTPAKRSIPDKLGHYRILDRIGTGGMASVYRAVDERTGEERALKVLHPHLAVSLTSIKRFEREFQVTARLRHEHLVPLLEQGHDGDWHYLVMERVYASSVANLEPPASTAERAAWAVSICIDVCNALEYIHRHDVIHRDIKPGNILIDDQGRAALADFGFARLYDELSLSLTATGQLIGTPYYMSPEQILARKIGVDARSDVFSLGAVLYELLTGRRPFAGESENQVFYAISFSEVQPPRAEAPEIPIDVETVCLKALEKAPDHRYRSAADMGADLARCLEGAGITARRPGQLRRVGRRLARRKVRWAAAVLVAALAISVAKIVLDDAGLAALARAQKASLSVTTARPGAHVTLQRLDLRSGEFAGATRHGRTPLRAVRIEPGYYRVVLSDADGRFQELSRSFAAGEESVLSADLLMQEPATDEMVLIPAGRFLAGQSPESDLFPLEAVEQDAFLVDAHEVTIGQYKAFLEATPGVPWPAIWGERYDPAWAELPAAGMHWGHARQYAEYVGKRLLTRRERLRVARGSDAQSILPGLVDVGWEGNAAVHLTDGDLGQDRASRFASFVRLVPPVGSFPRDVSSEGVFDLLGGVSEWVDGIGISHYGGQFHPERGQRHAVGYSWCESGEPFLEAIYSLPVGMDLDLTYVGIRCARSAGAPELTLLDSTEKPQNHGD